jgi:signal transduction histidine kinase
MYSASVIIRRNNLMQLPEFTHSTTLRWTLLVAGTFAAFIVALLGFVYLKTKADLTMRSDRVIASQIGVFAELPPERRLDAINEHLKQDPARVQLAGWFDSNRRRIAGNLESLPPDLKTDNAVLSAVVGRADESGREKQAVRLIGRSLPNGDVLVIGRNVDEVGEIARVVGRALALGLAPAVLLCLAIGVALSARARKRIVEVSERVQRMELAPALPMILGDRVQLQHVIINLVMNGIEAMQSVTDRPRELVIRSGQDETTHRVPVSVTDSGVGICAKDADRLFNAFFTTKSSGMGMGLSICRSIVEAHGGRLSASDHEGRGATFQFVLPLHQEEAS